jgi:hypothetical protein
MPLLPIFFRCYFSLLITLMPITPGRRLPLPSAAFAAAERFSLIAAISPRCAPPLLLACRFRHC